MALDRQTRERLAVLRIAPHDFYRWHVSAQAAWLRDNRDAVSAAIAQDDADAPQIETVGAGSAYNDQCTHAVNSDCPHYS